ncbi:hypothetical protein LV475_09410 [Guyparkeria hydrothermalis]|uniref:hypothetical protein n=1 Tax=Guyparkeria TaxID=2035712 RepID=UPI0010AC6EDC|nr:MULTISPECIES: hypothetical protein [Guyparkeria]MCL7751807.1 hypothetical protein [Guyparkeria hydrothermalis]TKA89155.1 hypothetical protein FAZ79_06615 [Guyparkeria sp. SB14A]
MGNRQTEYELYLDYKRGEGDPSRVFHAMGNMIDMFSNLDEDLGAVISSSCTPSVVLTDIESGSIRSKLRDVLIDLPDEALNNADIRQLIGHFLLKSKYAIIRWCDKRDSVESIDEIKSLEDEIESLAKESNVKKIPAYSPINRKRLLENLNHMSNALSVLEEHDSLAYWSPLGKVQFNKRFSISTEIITTVLTDKIITQRGTYVLKIKKPDYLGNSKWSVRHNGHSVDAKISDMRWLFDFQKKGGVSLQPGDSIRADLKQDTAIGYEGEIVHTWYEVEKVHEVIHAPPRNQQSLF